MTRESRFDKAGECEISLASFGQQSELWPAQFHPLRHINYKLKFRLVEKEAGII
jgi:hypothetical protein